LLAFRKANLRCNIGHEPLAAARPNGAIGGIRSAGDVGKGKIRFSTTKRFNAAVTNLS